MSVTIRRRDPRSLLGRTIVMAIPGVIVGAGLDVWASAAIGASIDGRPRPSGNPIIAMMHMTSGGYAWPGTAATVCVFVLPLIFGAVVGYPLWYRLAGPGQRPAVDRAVPHLARLGRPPRREVEAPASRLIRLAEIRPDAPAHNGVAPGIYIGRAVRGRRDVWASWEDMHFDIWGPRSGKTTSRAIPAIISAPGVCIVTSNKRDIVDATRGIREKTGEVWVFDPQNQAGEEPTWYWDPLSFIPNGNIRFAVMLGGIFSSANRTEHQRSDGFFQPAAEALIGYLLLAAARENRVITDVYRWLNNPNDDTPIRILHQYGDPAAAQAVEMHANSPVRQREGVYGTARQIVSFLADPGILRWITPDPEGRKKRFDHWAFAETDSDTLYMLSEESNRMAAPLVVAFTMAMAISCEGRSQEVAQGRLPVPAMFVLDEAANVCPWAALPHFYSHFGSRGIIVMTIIQSWAQGVEVWGQEGMSQMWDAANVRVYGGGGGDMQFLGDISTRSGPFEAERISVSHGWMQMFGRTISRSTSSEAIFSKKDLAALPRGRAVVQMSGSPPQLVHTIPWWEGPRAAEVQDSIDRYGPK